MNKTIFYTDKKNLVLLSVAKLLSGFSSYIYDVGIVIYLFEETQSVAAIGVFFICQLLPAFIILLSGQVIDCYNKKKLIIYSNIGKCVIFLFLILNRNIGTIYICTFLFNLLIEFEGNAFNSFMTNIFSREKILGASSVINLLDSFSMIVAPISASLIALHFKLNANLFLALFLFALTVISYSFIEICEQQFDVKKKAIKNKQAYFNIIKDKTILLTVIFWNIFMFCIGITTPLEISMIEDTLKAPSSYYGVGNTIEGIGMLIASGFVLGIIKKLKSNYIIMIGLFSAAFSYYVIGISENIVIYFIGAFLVGMTSAFCPLGFKTEIQIKSDPSIIGRTFTTARFTVLLSRIIGTFIVEWALKTLGIRHIYYWVASILSIAAILYAYKTIIIKKSHSSKPNQ